MQASTDGLKMPAGNRWPSSRSTQWAFAFRARRRPSPALNHPRICTLHDVGENHLVMEYIDGTPWRGPLPVSEVVKLGAQIADALDAALSSPSGSTASSAGLLDTRKD